MPAKRLYTYLVTLLVVGFAWVIFQMTRDLSYGENQTSYTNVEVCLFRALTGAPCPACGSSRAIVTLLNGSLVGALWYNPLGVILLLGIIIVTPWLVFDIVTRRQTLYSAWNFLESHFVKRKIYIFVMVVALLANWVWNMFKYL